MLSLNSNETKFGKLKFIKNLFELYGIYQFRINNKELLEKTSIQFKDEEIEEMNNFVSLVNQAINCLNEDEQKIIELSFIQKIHYTKCNYSQSSFFAKRKKTTLKLYDLIFTKCQNFELYNKMKN